LNDNYLILIFLSGTILFVIFACAISVYLIVYKRKQNAYQSEKRNLIFDHQKKLLNTRIEEQERTMDQMSKEIHDNIGQLLNFTKMNLYPIAKYATDPKQAELIEKTQALLDQLIKDTDNLSHSFNSDYIKGHGLKGVLDEELEYINISQEIKSRIEINGNIIAFNPDKELLIYRIAQEAIHNIIKHAQASEFTITLNYNPDTFIMSIADNGVGFEKTKMYELNGIGFLNMLNRAKILEGTLDIESQPLNGCLITLHINDINELCLNQLDKDEIVINRELVI